jgi:ethanolamine ammonia-lyase small subunit
MAYKPHSGQTDADRNLISNIQAHGVSAECAAERITGLLAQMMAGERSGTSLKEDSRRLTNEISNPMDVSEPEDLD